MFDWKKGRSKPIQGATREMSREQQHTIQIDGSMFLFQKKNKENTEGGFGFFMARGRKNQERKMPSRRFPGPIRREQENNRLPQTGRFLAQNHGSFPKKGWLSFRRPIISFLTSITRQNSFKYLSQTGLDRALEITTMLTQRSPSGQFGFI